MTIASNTPTPALGTLANTATSPAFTTMGRILHKRLAAPTWTTPIDPTKRQAAIGLALTADLERLARQQAIENALSAALHLVRTTDTAEGFLKATGRAIRAASMLKQACAEANSSGRA